MNINININMLFRFAFQPTEKELGVTSDTSIDKKDDMITKNSISSIDVTIAPKSSEAQIDETKIDDTSSPKSSDTKANDAITPKSRTHVYTMGSGDIAQLGLGTTESMRERKYPTQNKYLDEEDIIAISAGSQHNLALTRDGRVFSWGCNDEGALGRVIENDSEEFIPKLVDKLKDKKIVQIACGASHSVVLDTNGQVYSWGAYRNSSGLVGFTGKNDKAFEPIHIAQINNVKKIACGESHTLALSNDGTVYYWGDTYVGRRNSERQQHLRLIPRYVEFRYINNRRKKRTYNDIDDDIKLNRQDAYIKDIFTGGYTCFAISKTNRLWSWGLNNYSQCGIPRPKDSETFSITVPTIVPYFSQINRYPIFIASAIHYTLILTNDYNVYGFGRNDDGRLGQPSNYIFNDSHEQTIPLKISTLSMEELSSSNSWDTSNDKDTLFEQPYHEYMKGRKDDHVISLACGEAHSMAVTKTGRLFTWGNGDLYQLGTGKTATQYTPYWVRSYQITTLGRRVFQADAGSQHTILLATDL